MTVARTLFDVVKVALRRLPRTPSLDGLLGMVSGTILAWNTVPGLLPPTLGEVVSRTAGASVDSLSPLVTLCLSVLLLGLVVANFLPRLYVGPLREPVERYPRLRRVLVTYGFAVGAVFYLSFLAVSGSGLPAGLPGPPEWLFNAVVVAGILPVGVVLSRIESRPVSHPENYFARPMVRLSTDDDAAESWRSEFETLASRERLQKPAAAMITVAGTALFVVPATLLGVFVGTLSLYYPVIEIVALAGAVGSVALRSDRTPDPESALGGRFDAARDVDATFYRQLRTAITPRAWGVFLPVFFGVLTAVAPLLLSHAYHVPTAAFRPTGLVDAYLSLFELRTVGSLGYVLDATGDAAVWAALSVTPLVVVCYCLWYWFRVVRRVPTLQYHAGSAPVRARLPDAAKTPDVSRPKGYVLPLGLVVWTWLSHRFLWGESFVPIPAAQSDFGFLLLWSAGVGLLVWTVYDAVRTEPSVPESPVGEIYVPLGVQVIVVMDMGLDRAAEVSGLLTVLVLVVALYYLLPNVERLFELDRPRRLLATAVVGAVFAVLVWINYSAGYGLLVGGAVFAVFAIGGEWHDLIEAE